MIWKTKLSVFTVTVKTKVLLRLLRLLHTLRVTSVVARSNSHKTGVAS